MELEADTVKLLSAAKGRQAGLGRARKPAVEDAKDDAADFEPVDKEPDDAEDSIDAHSLEIESGSSYVASGNS